MPSQASTQVDDPLAGRGERERAILRAAYRVMARRGANRLNLQDIADEAGVSKGLLLYHFENKAQVLQLAMQWALIASVQRMSAAVEEATIRGDEDPLSPLLDAIFVSPKANRDFHLVYVDLVEHASHEEAFGGLIAVLDSIIDPIYEQVVAEGVARGRFVVDHLDDPPRTMRTVVDGAFFLWLQDADWETSHATVKERCHRMLRALLLP